LFVCLIQIDPEARFPFSNSAGVVVAFASGAGDGSGAEVVLSKSYNISCFKRQDP